VDNHSQEAETLAYYAQLQQAANIVLVKNQSAFNYSAYNNLGARHAHGDLLLFLNDDVEVIDPCWLDELVQWAERSDIGAVGAKLLYPDGSIQHAGIVVGMEGHGSHAFMGAREGYTGPFGSVEWYRDVSAVTGACLMMRRSVFDQVGGFDERLWLVFNDIELGARVLAHGYRVVYNPFARLIHYEGKSRGRYIPADDIRLGYERLKETVAQGDPYYNPNLSYTNHLPTLRRTWEEDRLHRLETIVRFAI
jgi:GT2 family glycosyltransferase